MKEILLILHESMLHEMEGCRQARTRLSTIECCFAIANQYWTQVQMQLEEHVFYSEREEIEFYKLVKPKFKSQIEYYNLLYQAEILKPQEGIGEMKEFWIREQMKLERFIQDHPVFYAYQQSGASDQDTKFFLSANNENDNAKNMYHDDLISMLLALERYSIYVKKELAVTR